MNIERVRHAGAVDALHVELPEDDAPAHVHGGRVPESEQDALDRVAVLDINQEVRIRSHPQVRSRIDGMREVRALDDDWSPPRRGQRGENPPEFVVDERGVQEVEGARPPPSAPPPRREAAGQNSRRQAAAQGHERSRSGRSLRPRHRAPGPRRSIW